MSNGDPGGIVAGLFRLAAAVLSILAITAGSGPSENGPRMEDGQYELPAGDVIVIQITENNGSVSPEFQSGYAVEIDARGHAEFSVTPAGASGDMTDPTAEPRLTIAEFGEDGIQALLKQLDAIGLFDLAHPGDEAPPSASADRLEVTLDDGSWLIQHVDLDEDVTARLDLAQALIVATVQAAASN